jgi:hypothetical protein
MTLRCARLSDWYGILCLSIRLLTNTYLSSAQRAMAARLYASDHSARCVGYKVPQVMAPRACTATQHRQDNLHPLLLAPSKPWKTIVATRLSDPPMDAIAPVPLNFKVCGSLHHKHYTSHPKVTLVYIFIYIYIYIEGTLPNGSLFDVVTQPLSHSATQARYLI